MGITAFQPLVQAVVQKSSDIEVWKQVLQTITSTSQITPPPSITASFGGTPRTHSSASHQGSEQTKRLLHDALKDELYDCSYVDVPGFFEKYFDDKSWTEKGEDIFKSVKHTHSDGRWTTFPSDPIESAVWSWWSRFQHDYLTDSRGIYYTTGSKKEMTGLDSEGQLDILLKRRDARSSNPHDWADVCVIGEHTVSTGGGSKFLQLARYARQVFSAQPRRQFVHGFILSKTKLELGVFDRSGAFSAEPFDIHKEPERFIRTIAGYCMMSDEELGLDTFIEREGKKEFVTVFDKVSGEHRRLQLETRPIARQAAVVGRGTSCYRTIDHKNVVKFSWVSASRSPTEPDLLTLARERKVQGIPRLIGHRRTISTGELRSLLTFSKRRRLQSRQRRIDASFSSHFGSLPFSDETGEGKKRKSTDADQGSSTKKSRSNSQASKLSQVHEAGDSFNDSQSSFTSQATNEKFVDRVLCYQATRPAGRPLAKFRSIPELLRAVCDVIKVHRALFLDGKILHRDVSETNMIITDVDENDGFCGMLIDVELGTIVEDGKNTRTEGKRMTGTLKFMAIEVVELALRDARRDLEHTYRHDLESFFYVFLAMCIDYGWEEGKKPKVDPLQSWYIGSYDSIVGAKLGHMGLNGFETLILPKFSPAFECVKGLAMSLRDALFLRGGKLRTGTPAEFPSVLYNQMIAAFDKAIESLEDCSATSRQ